MAEHAKIVHKCPDNSLAEHAKIVPKPTETRISGRIRARVVAAGHSCAANASISEFVGPGELDLLEEEVRERAADLLDALIIDTVNDHNTQGTAARIAKLYIREVFSGRYLPPPELTDFPNSKKLDELYVLGPMAIRSACSHHLCPVEGDLWCGVIPNHRIIGISKFSRLARWITSRPQIQEEAIIQLADKLEELIMPRGLGVIMKLRHSCMTWRGVKEHATVMTTSVMRGILRESPASRSELFAHIGNQ